MKGVVGARRLAWRLTVGLAMAGVLVLTGCTPGAPAADQPELLDGQHSSTIGRSVQYGAFTVTAGHAVYDQVAKTLYVGTRWTNLSDHYATAPSHFESVRLELPKSTQSPVTGAVVGLSESNVPPGMSTVLTFAWSQLAANPLAGGKLLIGTEKERVATISLADGSGKDQLSAREVTVDQWASFGPHTIHVERALVTAGHLSDNSQADAAHKVLRIGFDVWTSNSSRVGWVPTDSLALRRPDGVIVKSREVPSEREVTWGAIDDSWAEFEIPDHSVGTYHLLLFRRAPGLFGEPVVGNSAVEIPITIRSSDLRKASAGGRPDAADLPWPTIAARRTTAGSSSTPHKDRQISIDAPAVNAAGYAIKLVHGVYSPAEKSLDLSVEASFEGADAGSDGPSSAPSLDLPTALEFDGSVAGGRLLGNGTDAGVVQQLTLSYQGIPESFDPTTAKVHFGNNAWIALAGASAPAVPRVLTAKAKRAAAGEFTVDVHGYRVGYFTGADLAPGSVELEIAYDVTTSSDASTHTTFFNPTSQIFLSRDDGYVTAASPLDLTSILQLEVGVPKPVTTTFVVPRSSLKGGKIYLLVRSRDETDFPPPEGWLETTIPVTLTHKRLSGQ